MTQASSVLFRVVYVCGKAIGGGIHATTASVREGKMLDVSKNVHAAKFERSVCTLLLRLKAAVN